MRSRVAVAALIAALATTMLIVGGCTPSEAGSTQQLRVTGSTTVLPIAEVAAEDFMDENPGKRVFVAGVGSSEGIEAVAHGRSDIGTSSRDLKDEEQGLGLVDTPVALDAIAVIVHPDNPVESLTTSQVAQIFEGRIKNWKEVGGRDEEIGLVNRDEASGTREAFTKIVLKGGDFDPTAAVLPGTGQVRSVVGQSTIAIGYISLGFVNDSVKALKVDGIPANEETVADLSYPVSRVLHFFTKGEPQGLAKAYIDYVLSERIQEDVVREAGFLPIGKGGE